MQNEAAQTPRESYRCVAVIPALNPGPALAEYARTLLARGIPRVVVVDDGSAPDQAPTFRALEALPGCVVLRHARNQGKGRALKTAFAHILEQPDLRAYDGVVTADADGQHHVEDVCAMAQRLSESPGGLVLGARDLRQDHVPARSKFGNRLTSFGFGLFYGTHLDDTQTGLRGIPAALLPWSLAVAGERFEYEMNVLIRAVRERVPYRTLPIHTIYYDNNAGTHLRTVRDSWRIFRILLSGLGRYAAAAFGAAALDLFVFWLAYRFLYGGLPELLCLWAAVATARILSSALDVACNQGPALRRLSPAFPAALRFFYLWLAQLVCSGGLTILLYKLTRMPPLLCKFLMDFALGILSYQVRMRWVFSVQPAGAERGT